MRARYFDLSDDVHVPGRWYLGNPVNQEGEELDPWVFRKGMPVELQGQLRAPIYRPGRALDFSTAGIGMAPVVHRKLASLLAKLAPGDVQLLPVDIESHSDQYSLVNVIRVVKCIDDNACAEVQSWMPEDGRPEKTGQYRAVSGLRVDPGKVGPAKVFRTWGWSIALIVSEEIKEAMASVGAIGAKFQEV